MPMANPRSPGGKRSPMMLLPSVYGQVAVSYLDLSENMLQRE